MIVQCCLMRPGEKNGCGDQFVKPSPVHTMTAILFSSGVDIIDTLRLSYDYFFNDQHSELVDYLSRFAQPLNVCLFEDSITGIQALEISYENLKKDGFEINIIAYGISTEQNKIDSLMNENAIIFPTINEAFSACVDFLKILKSSNRCIVLVSALKNRLLDRTGWIRYIFRIWSI